MGCCFSTGDGEGVQLLGRKRVEIQRINVTTPTQVDVPIDGRCTVTLKLEARRDASRTVEVSFMDAKDKKKFDQALESVLAARFTPQNSLSEPHWKTAQPYERTDSIETPGMHYLVIRSSSVLSDKNVRISGRIIKQYS